MSTAEPHAAGEPLASGQRMTRVVFHELYKSTPRGKFELIGGVVFMASPLGWKHGFFHANAIAWLAGYRFATPGIEILDNASAALDDQSEVQPDISLRIKSEFGGQTHRFGSFLGGVPELVIEIADSSKRTDLGPKLIDYERAGALEYVVFALEPDEIHWHLRRDGRLIRVSPDGDGLYRSAAFPGLWLDPVAFFADDGPALAASLNRGLATPDHAAFVERMSAAQAR